jgi:molybdopterin synthase sulfur carrier subunit
MPGIPAVTEELNMMQHRNETVMTGTRGRITVTVKAFATLREVMDSELRLDFFAGTTIRSLLAELTGRYRGLSDQIFSDPDTLRDFVNILKNGRNIHFLAGLDTPLDDGDTIVLFPPAAGG